MKRSKSSASKKPQTPFQKFHEELKKSNPVQESPQKPVNPLYFNQKQRKAYDIVLKKLTDKKSKEPLRMIVQGTAGTGKSAIINALCTLLDKHKKRYKVASFTGSSAFLVKGATLHRSFFLPMFRHNHDAKEFGENGAHLKSIEYFIFDEFSLIGLNLFGYISERLQAVHGNSHPFGNKSILLFGDFSQLCPVGDRALFTKNEDGHLAGLDLQGYLAYRTFDKAVVLEESMRQAGPEQEEFRRMLLRIRRGELTQDDIVNLNKRYIRNLSVEELEEFTQPDVTVLFVEKDAVNHYNKYRLGLLETEKVDIMPIDSAHAPPGCGEALELAVGCRVFLNTNILVAGGLFNGALGNVTAFGPPRSDGKGPQCVYVRFDNYSGIPFGLRDDVPIIHHLGPASSAVHNCSFQREQIPLTLAFSITSHKAQGSELRRVVIGVPSGTKRNSMFFRLAPSILFVCISRVKSLKDLAFSKPFRTDLVVKENPSQHLKDWMAEEARLMEIESSM